VFVAFLRRDLISRTKAVNRQYAARSVAYNKATQFFGGKIVMMLNRSVQFRVTKSVGVN
jgi:hypothetical protein